MVIKALTSEQIDKAVKELGHSKIIVNNSYVKRLKYVCTIKPF